MNKKDEKNSKIINRDNVKEVFSNTVNIAASPREVLLDFGLVLPNSESKVVSSVILTKDHAFELRDTLNSVLKDYYE